MREKSSLLWLQVSMNNLELMAILDCTDDLLKESPRFGFGHLDMANAEQSAIVQCTWSRVFPSLFRALRYNQRALLLGIRSP